MPCPAAVPMVLIPTAYTTPYLAPLTRSISDSIQPLVGTTLTVTSFTTPSSPTPISPGSPPMRLVVPGTGDLAGMLAVSASGAFTFSPAVGFVGGMPAVRVLVARSDGQSRAVPLNITAAPPTGGVQPRKQNKKAPPMAALLVVVVLMPAHSTKHGAGILCTFSCPTLSVRAVHA